MKISIIVVGKTEDSCIKKHIDEYITRVNRYVTCSLAEIPAVKANKSSRPDQIKLKEARLIEKVIDDSDYIVLLDEKGKEFTSEQFSGYLQKKMITGIKKLVFIVGGPFGFDTAIYNRANEKISLSKMTFPHQLVRLFFAEQLYRAMSILRNESYHH